LNNKRGTKRRIWKYFNQMDIILKQADNFEKYERKKIDTKSAVYEFLTFYERIYELTIKILAEYAYIIADKAEKNDKNSSWLIERYNNYNQKGESLRRSDLIRFFKNSGFWEYGNNCSVLNSKLRNAVSHFNFYPTKNAIKINNNLISVEDLRNDYINLISFYSYIIGESLKKSDWFKSIKTMKNSIRFKLKTLHIIRIVTLQSRHLDN